MDPRRARLVVDGAPVAMAEEERFSRKKHDSGFPEHFSGEVVVGLRPDSSSVQEALDSYDDRNGVFAYALREGLRGIQPVVLLASGDEAKAAASAEGSPIIPARAEAKSPCNFIGTFNPTSLCWTYQCRVLVV